MEYSGLVPQTSKQNGFNTRDNCISIQVYFSCRLLQTSDTPEEYSHDRQYTRDHQATVSCTSTSRAVKATRRHSSSFLNSRWKAARNPSYCCHPLQFLSLLFLSPLFLSCRFCRSCLITGLIPPLLSLFASENFRFCQDSLYRTTLKYEYTKNERKQIHRG